MSQVVNKIGYGIQNLMTYGRSFSAEEEQALFDHLVKAQSSTSLFLDNEGRAERLKKLIPGCAVVVRSYRSQGDEGKLFDTLSPQQVFDLYKNTPKGLIRNILNEPSGYGDLKKIAHFVAQVMDIFGNAGIPIVAPNWGEGHPDVDRLGELEEMWVAYDRWHDVHFYGGHEYGSHLGMLYNVAGKFDMTPWRVGRFETFIVPYLQKHGHKIPNVILTEAGCDSAHDGTAYRGWKTCWTQDEYFTQLKAAIDQFYCKPHYVGLCLFSWGNTGQQFTENDWASFDLSQAKDFQKKVEGLASADVPPLAPVLVPKPTNAITPLRIRVKNEMFVRYGPGTGFKNIGAPATGPELKPGNLAVIWLDSQSNDGRGRDWVFVNISSGDYATALVNKGWVSLTDLKYEERVTKEIPKVDPSTPPVVAPTAPAPDIDDPEVTPVTPRTFTYTMQIQVKAETEIAAEKVAEYALASVRYDWQRFLEIAKLSNSLSQIKDASFVIELPGKA